MSNTVFTTPKGTKLELVKLKSKDYMIVSQRLLWLNEEMKSFTINTEFLKLEENYAVCRATVNLYNESGNLIKSATATKREDVKHFPDFIEKCETSSVGRAVSMLGFGTLQAQQDFDELETIDGKEVNRLADMPLAPLPKTKQEANVEVLTPTVEAPPKPKTSSFRKPAKVEVKEEKLEGWE